MLLLQQPLLSNKAFTGESYNYQSWRYVTCQHTGRGWHARPRFSYRTISGRVRA
jgi:hypothetical protein